MVKSIGFLALSGLLVAQTAFCSPSKKHKETKHDSDSGSDSKVIWLNGVDDFCLYAPPPPSPDTIGDAEARVVSYCTTSAHGTNVMPKGTLTGVHFVQTPDYVQVTGTGDFTKINIKAGDEGGELDPHGATGQGNPVGGTVFGNTFSPGLQYYEWTNFMSATEFCIRACTGDNAATNCQHIYDTMGCAWNMPANYASGTFESCDGDSSEPMGVYGTSTWYQGVSPTPSAHDIPSSSNCQSMPSPASASKKSKRGEAAAFHPVSATPLPK